MSEYSTVLSRTFQRTTFFTEDLEDAFSLMATHGPIQIIVGDKIRFQSADEFFSKIGARSIKQLTISLELENTSRMGGSCSLDLRGSEMRILADCKDIKYFKCYRHLEEYCKTNSLYSVFGYLSFRYLMWLILLWAAAQPLNMRIVPYLHSIPVSEPILGGLLGLIETMFISILYPKPKILASKSIADGNFLSKYGAATWTAVLTIISSVITLMVQHYGPTILHYVFAQKLK